MKRGFLPEQDPLTKLPKGFEAWEEIAVELPKLLGAKALRPVLDRLPVLPIESLKTRAEIERGMMLLSYFGHGYVWENWYHDIADRIPKGVAVPWARLAKILQRPPVLSYASYALYNWRRIDPKGPIALGNVALLQNFLGGLDEEWFILVHVDIEAKAADGIAAIVPLQNAIKSGKAEIAQQLLGTIAKALRGMNQTMDRMPEGCDPYIYYNRVRPYIHGWKDHPQLPAGVVYEGVEEFAGKGQFYRGETGAQSTIIPSFDGALGVGHTNDRMKTYLNEMRDYMPLEHRQFLTAVEQGPDLRAFVANHSDCKENYNACIVEIDKFRKTHLDFAKSYIFEQAQKSAANPTQVGTGGTPFVPYLKKHWEETKEHKIK